MDVDMDVSREAVDLLGAGGPFSFFGAPFPRAFNLRQVRPSPSESAGGEDENEPFDVLQTILLLFINTL